MTGLCLIRKHTFRGTLPMPIENPISKRPILRSFQQESGISFLSRRRFKPDLITAARCTNRFASSKATNWKGKYGKGTGLRYGAVSIETVFWTFLVIPAFTNGRWPSYVPLSTKRSRFRDFVSLASWTVGVSIVRSRCQ